MGTFLIVTAEKKLKNFGETRELEKETDMEKKRPGITPLRSDEIFEYALNALKENEALELLPEDAFREESEALKGLLPDHFFTDIYMDIPLQGGASRGMAIVMDCYERCYVDYISEGEYFRNNGLPATNAPEDRDDILVIRNGKDGVEFFSISGKLKETALLTEDNELAGLSCMDELCRLPVHYIKEPCEEGLRLIVTTGSSGGKLRFTKMPHKDGFIRILSEAGCGGEALSAIENASFNCGVPFLHPGEGYREWIACVDVAAFAFTVKKDKICDCHAVIRISDKSLTISGQTFRLSQAYQWHITDRCDQRCKHCYLFAEEARLKCIDTPWDQLMLTLEEITADAERRFALPMLAVSGGDPILHPDFWRFAEELHRRGIYWVIMGNPFHLDEEVCKRMYQLGCRRYQLSLDGLEDFHDHMRKPGSFRETVRAIGDLRKAGIQAQVMATVSKMNLEDVLELMDHVVEIGATDFTFARYCATSPEKATDYPTPEEYRDFLYRYYRKAKDYREKNCHTIFRFKEHLFKLVRYELGEFEPSEFGKTHPDIIIDGCHMGQTCSILANGDILACRRMESVIGNVKTSHISDILTGDLCKSYKDIRNIKKCKNCELLQYCRGCRAVGFNATGDLQCEDPCCWKEV